MQHTYTHILRKSLNAHTHILTAKHKHLSVSSFVTVSSHLITHIHMRLKTVCCLVIVSFGKISHSKCCLLAVLHHKRVECAACCCMALPCLLTRLLLLALAHPCFALDELVVCLQLTYLLAYLLTPLPCISCKINSITDTII